MILILGIGLSSYLVEGGVVRAALVDRMPKKLRIAPSGWRANRQLVTQ